MPKFEEPDTVVVILALVSVGVFVAMGVAAWAFLVRLCM